MGSTNKDTITTEVTEVDVHREEFSFDEWAVKIGLNRKTTQILRSQDCISLETLKLLKVTDIVEFGLTIGQKRVLEAAVINIQGNKPAKTAEDRAVSSKQDNSQNSTQNDPISSPTRDTGNKKAIHITDFLSASKECNIIRGGILVRMCD